MRAQCLAFSTGLCELCWNTLARRTSRCLLLLAAGAGTRQERDSIPLPRACTLHCKCLAEGGWHCHGTETLA